ncbi:metallophosphoesterase family protein [Thermosulfurimonas dismutans]|uniref:Serine/threonine protein phosphatase n=1 Tax=Thermosulfurimonas dismutans TaxID=999894 RepID=A0A179D560_9BACT|nr:metallophosphoesterase family protein [Thermosulfurimonas dismutans]OAQ20738.1 Serine/threonine protein phosphatase [Thermosulfurimonas dismutans]
MKIFAVGDVHGCAEALEALLDRLPVEWGKDLLIFLGDYIDRGPSPRKVIEMVKKLVTEYPNKVIALSGNHEWMFKRYLKGIESAVFLYNGGEITLRDYFERGKLNIPEEDLNFLESLPLYYETKDFFFVHAGIRPGIPFDKQDEEDLLWIRESFYYYPGKFEKTIVFGHTPFPEPLDLPDRIGIDTGCVYGGKLTAVELPARKYYQVDCLRRWV